MIEKEIKLSHEDIEKASKVNLLEYCQANGIPVVEHSTNNPHLEEHDSLVFFPDNINRQWHRFSNGDGGDSIDFVRFYEGRSLPDGEEVSFQYAVKKLLSQDYKKVVKKEIVQPKFEYQNFEVSNHSKAREYLVRDRKIDERLVDNLFESDLIAQDQRSNVVFKWRDYDEKREIIGANVQGTERRIKEQRSFKRIQKNSKSGTGFNLRFGEPRHVKFFESAIDLLSYASLYPEHLENSWFVSMEGLKRGVVMKTFKTCSKYRENNEDYMVDSVHFCVDNDEAGRGFAEEFIDSLQLIDPITQEKQSFVLDVPKYTKDWNDELIFLKENRETNVLKKELLKMGKDNHEYKLDQSEPENESEVILIQDYEMEL